MTRNLLWGLLGVLLLALFVTALFTLALAFSGAHT